MTGGEIRWDGLTCEDWSGRHDLSLFEAHSTIDSTNKRMRALVEDGTQPISVVVANEQTAGRGRGGKRWVSPPGGIWFSILTPTPVGPLGQMVPLVAGLAVSRAVTHVSGVATKLKWPNDVLIGEDKLGGILCEVAPSGRSGDGANGHIITGIGVNLRAPEGGWPADLVERPCALSDHLKWPLGELRRALLGAIISEFSTLLRTTSADDFQHMWSPLDALRGREVVCSMGVRGTARGIDGAGSLLVETAEALVPVPAGSVRLYDPSNSTHAEKAGPE